MLTELLTLIYLFFSGTILGGTLEIQKHGPGHFFFILFGKDRLEITTGSLYR